ncbi:MAG: hypothetical protein NTU83_09210, partial [Candidatus Hydrogenedentes bacterium]|nr:hypothetical protein [Candidatus Hydrogenedentota bacterium]
MLKDVEPSGGSYPWQFAKWGNAVYFMASDASYQTELWRTDGTDTGTLPVKTFDNVGMTAMKLAASQLYLFTGVTAQGRAIWRSDGTEAGTRLVKVLVPPSGTSSSIYVAVIGDLAFWCGDDGVNGKELWRSDGTEAGTFMLKRINAGGDTHPANLMVYQGMLYFSAD